MTTYKHTNVTLVHESYTNNNLILSIVHDGEDTEKYKFMAKIANFKENPKCNAYILLKGAKLHLAPL